MQSVEDQPTFRKNTSAIISGRNMNHSKNNASHSPLLATCLMLVSCLAQCLMMMMEAACFSETTVQFQRTEHRFVAKYIIIHRSSCPHFYMSLYNRVGSGQATARRSEYGCSIPEAATTFSVPQRPDSMTIPIQWVQVLGMKLNTQTHVVCALALNVWCGA